MKDFLIMFFFLHASKLFDLIDLQHCFCTHSKYLQYFLKLRRMFVPIPIFNILKMHISALRRKKLSSKEL